MRQKAGKLVEGWTLNIQDTEDTEDTLHLTGHTAQ